MNIDPVFDFKMKFQRSGRPSMGYQQAMVASQDLCGIRINTKRQGLTLFPDPSTNVVTLGRKV